MSLTGKTFCFLLTLILLFGCISCVNLTNNKKDQLFYKKVSLKSSDDINNNMTMTWSEYMPEPYHPGDDLWVDVNIKSKVTPLSATNLVFSFYVYYEEIDQWEEVENQVPNNYNNLELYPIEGIDPLPVLLMGVPGPVKLEGSDMFLRIFCSIEILEDSIPVGKKMSSFMDIEVVPKK